MRRTALVLFAGLVGLLWAAGTEGADKQPPVHGGQEFVALAHTLWERTDPGAGHAAATRPMPVEPLARQELILAAIRRSYHAAGLSAPATLARRASEVASQEELAVLLEQAWPRLRDRQLAPLDTDLRRGLWAIGEPVPLQENPRQARGKPRPGEHPDLAALARQVWELTGAVLDHHIEPPSRQQMILRGISAVHRAGGMPRPAELAARVSSVVRAEQLGTLLTETWSGGLSAVLPAADLEEAFTQGVLLGVPGGAQRIAASEIKVQQQLDANLYVGLHIALRTDDKAGRPALADVFPGGPADRAGLKNGDVIEEIAGTSTKGMPLVEAVRRLRGDEGTEIVIRVRRAGAKDLIEARMTRGRLPHPTLNDARVVGTGLDAVGYLRVEEIAGSTPQELRVLARRLEDDGARALVVDLRTTHTARLHATALLADALLDRGIIGRLRTVDRVVTYRAEPDTLFRGWPMAVLIAERTAPEAAWLAAALHDNGRALLVGQPSRGGFGVPSTVPIGRGPWAIRLVTGRLERGDGRPFSQQNAGLTPAERSRAGNTALGGIAPDIVAGSPARTEVQPGAPLPRGYAEEAARKDKRDVVLEKALDCLRARLKTPKGDA